jgi:alkylated DNA repair dioxygenase AlkB
MNDLFASSAILTRLPMEDADVSHAEYLEIGASTEVTLQRLITEIPWRSESVVLWGKKYQQPRLIAWYGDVGTNYTYSGITLSPLPWTQNLRDIKRSVEELAGATFNSVLANYYRNNRDSMGFHSDDEPELGHSPTIASVSFGETRTFVMRHKFRRDVSAVKLKLGSGGVLLMKGATQTCWEHGIPKQTRPCGPRVNLTFRRILQASQNRP